MWWSPKRALPGEETPVIIMTLDGDVVWARCLADGWYESDADAKIGNRITRDLHDVYAWTNGKDMARKARAEKAKD